MSIVAYATEWSDAPHMNLVAGRPKSPIVAVVMSGMGGDIVQIAGEGGGAGISPLPELPEA
jgi:glutamate synthase domain-containing protein 2